MHLHLMQGCWRYRLLFRATREGTHARPATQLEWLTNTSLSQCKVGRPETSWRDCFRHIVRTRVAHSQFHSLSLRPLPTIPEPPEIRSVAEEIQVVLHHGAVLPCEVQGFPRPSITWQREGVPIATGNDTVRPSFCRCRSPQRLLP